MRLERQELEEERPCPLRRMWLLGLAFWQTISQPLILRVVFSSVSIASVFLPISLYCFHCLLLFVLCSGSVFVSIFSVLLSRFVSQEISGLDCVPGLRVLMLGKNHIKKIDNLRAVSKLDVLDLHSNRIKIIGRWLCVMWLAARLCSIHDSYLLLVYVLCGYALRCACLPVCSPSVAAFISSVAQCAVSKCVCCLLWKLL